MAEFVDRNKDPDGENESNDAEKEIVHRLMLLLHGKGQSDPVIAAAFRIVERRLRREDSGAPYHAT